jgi:hypothetical protein
MGQICPVLVFVSFTLKSVTKLNSVKHLRSWTHLDTVASAPAVGGVLMDPPLDLVHIPTIRASP